MKGKSRAIMATLVGIAFSGAVQAALVAEWNFDDQSLANSGSSGAIHDGAVITGATTNATVVAATFSTDTPSGTGYALDLSSAAEYMMVTNSATNHTGYVDTFDAPTTFSYSLWMKSPSGSWDKWDELAGKGYQDEFENSGEANSVGWTMRSRYGTDGTMVSFYRPNTTVTVQDTDPSINLLNQVWHLLTFTYDSATSTLTLYVDGVEEASATGAVMLEAIGQVLVFDARENPFGRQSDCLYDNIQFYDHALDAAEVSALYIEQYALIVNPNELAMELTSPATMVTGSVEVAYVGDINFEVAVSISNETHSGAFSVLSDTSLTLTDPSPSNTLVEFAFDNTVAGLTTNMESASCTAIFSWNLEGNTEVTEVQVPITLLYEVPDENLTIDELGSSPAAVNPLDLTAEGTTDWVMLGQGGVTNNRDEKADADYIGEVTVLGTHDAYAANAYLSSWIDGSPTASASGIQGGWEAKPPAVDGKQALTFSVDGLTPGGYTMKLYCSKYKATGMLTASNDTESYSADFDYGGTGDGSSYAVFTLNFPIATFGESLDVSLDVTEVGHTVYGNLSITAITLVQTSEDDAIVGDISLEIVSGGTEVALSWETSYGALYGVKATGNLTTGPWGDMVTDVAGTGSEVTVTNTVSGNAEFYRAYIQD